MNVKLKELGDEFQAMERSESLLAQALMKVRRTASDGAYAPKEQLALIYELADDALVESISTRYPRR